MTRRRRARLTRSSRESSRAGSGDTLDRILSTQEFQITGKDRIREAFEAYRAGRADFADYVIGTANRHEGCAETVTFDRRLRAAPGIRIL